VWALGRSSDLHVYFTLAGAMLLLLGVQNRRLFLGLFLLWVIALLASLKLAPINGFVLPEDTTLRGLLSSHAMINTIVINAAMLFYALTALHRAEIELQDQYERSEALIDTVMPASIATRLKSGREPRIADRIEVLTVMFADLAGFTSAAHDLPPDQVVEFLDRLVRTFDALAEKHGIENACRDQSGLMPADLITLAHFSVSSAMSLPNSIGVIGIGTSAKSASRPFILGSARPAVISLLILSITSAGVPIGAPTPNHAVIS
jgi:hypothetical protein